jgi:hypothetical protein
VLDLTPTLTERTVGAPRTGVPGGAPRGAWDYRVERPEAGGTLRWGVTNNLTLNATVRPEFSQVEADAAQVQFDPRQSLFFPERRPFFLDGVEQFATPGNLIYTRRIVQPAAAVKLAGKVAGTDVAVLSAVDAPRLALGPAPGGRSATRSTTSSACSATSARARAWAPSPPRATPGRPPTACSASTGAPCSAACTRPPASSSPAPRATAPARRRAPARSSRPGSCATAGGSARATRLSASRPTSSPAPGSSRAGIAAGQRDAPPHAASTGRARARAELRRKRLLDGLWKYDDLRRRRPMLERKLHLTGTAQLRGGGRAARRCWSRSSATTPTSTPTTGWTAHAPTTRGRATRCASWARRRCPTSTGC